jgi:hypothetical protein
MANRTLLQIVRQVQGELGLPQSATVIGNTDPTTVQMFNLANRAIDEMRRMAPTGWTAMQFEYDLALTPPTSTTGDTTENSAIITNIPSTAGLEANFYMVNGAGIPTSARIVSVDSATQITMSMEATATASTIDISFGKDTYPIPEDFDWFQNQTMWDRTNFWQLLGPDSPQFDQWHRSGIFTTGPRRHFRKIGPFANTFRLWPPPFELDSPIQLVFEYMSINAVAVSGSNTEFAQYFANDDDTPLLDAQALITGIKWMFFEIKGMNYIAMQNRWVDYVNTLMARDGAAPTLSLTPRTDDPLINPWMVQDGNFPGS